MKRMLLVLGLAGLLSMPSVVFGEATWYGSFRGGLESAGDSTHMFSNGSRWGVKGSNEVSEGLSANYRYEEALDLATASLSSGNRLSYVGLSGGFGTISVGRIWSASWNSVGALLDNSYVYGTSNTSYRVGPAVSYSNSVGAASVQLDLVMDKGNSAKSGVDQYEFGLSMDLGAATLAFAHRKKYVAAVTTTTETFVPGMAGTPTTVVVTPGTAGTPTGVDVTDGTPGTPTVVDVTAGTAGTPTMVDVTTGTAGTPTGVDVTPGTAGTPTGVDVTPGTVNTPTMVTVIDGGAGRPTTVTVTPAVKAVTGMDAVPEGTGELDPATGANSQTLLNANTMRPATAAGTNAVTPLAEATRTACEAVQGAVWVVGAATTNVAGDGACYVASEVTVRKNTIKSATTGAGDALQNVSPITAQGLNANVHRSSANCAAAVDDAGSAAAGVWEPNTRMCYPADTTVTYITAEARDAVEEVEAEDIMVEREPGEAGTPTDVDVDDGVAGTPTEVDVTNGVAGTPTEVDVTNGVAGTPTEVDVTPGTGSTPTDVDVTPGTVTTPTIVTVRDGTGGTPTTVEVTPGTAGTPSVFVTTESTMPAYDETLNAIAVKIAAGSHSAAVGLVKTSTSTDLESSSTIANAGGPLSDGLSYHFQIRDEEGSDNPWLFGLAKSLGGGSSLIFEHSKDSSDENSTALYLQVDF